MTRDTSDLDTPASSATSLIVGGRDRADLADSPSSPGSRPTLDTVVAADYTPAWNVPKWAWERSRATGERGSACGSGYSELGASALSTPGRWLPTRWSTDSSSATWTRAEPSGWRRSSKRRHRPRR